jgi:dimethylhistidine N-methyltransferase
MRTNAHLLLPEAGAAATRRFGADVLKGLRCEPKQLSCKYFDDEIGSELFERITQLPEHYPTRAELGLIQKHAADMACLLGRRCLLIEYGSGFAAKTRLLLDHLEAPAGYVPIDISGAYLRKAAEALAADYPELEVLPLCADFTRPFHVPIPQRSVARRVVYFPGTTVGNFSPDEVVTLFRRTAFLCGTGGGLLLGADLLKGRQVMEAAYNDSQGIAAAFNLNLLERINRELGGDFCLDRFFHHAYWCPSERRIEMHLVSRCDQCAHVAGHRFFFRAGEPIHTESSHKYSLFDLADLAEAGGLEPVHVWLDEVHFFIVQYFAVHQSGGMTKS